MLLCSVLFDIFKVSFCFIVIFFILKVILWFIWVIVVSGGSSDFNFVLINGDVVVSVLFVVISILLFINFVFDVIILRLMFGKI